MDGRAEGKCPHPGGEVEREELAGGEERIAGRGLDLFYGIVHALF